MIERSQHDDQRQDAPTISALVIAKNAERWLSQCLESVRWARELVVVVDASSLDSTEEIARVLADVVVLQTFEDFASQRNEALARATSDWVLAIDSDERCTPELRTEIENAVRLSRDSTAGFRIPIKSVILGRNFGFSGTQNDRPLRLFRRPKGRWVGKVHETVDLEGEVGFLKNPLVHETIKDMKTFITKVDHYTTLEAKELFARGKKAGPVELVLKPVWLFIKLYMFKQGFRDGLEGFVFCATSSFSLAARAFKQIELSRSGGSA